MLQWSQEVELQFDVGLLRNDVGPTAGHARSMPVDLIDGASPVVLAGPRLRAASQSTQKPPWPICHLLLASDQWTAPCYRFSLP